MHVGTNDQMRQLEQKFLKGQYTPFCDPHSQNTLEPPHERKVNTLHSVTHLLRIHLTHHMRRRIVNTYIHAILQRDVHRSKLLVCIFITANMKQRQEPKGKEKAKEKMQPTLLFCNFSIIIIHHWEVIMGAELICDWYSSRGSSPMEICTSSSDTVEPL